jgi:hypothetical protein
MNCTMIHGSTNIKYFWFVTAFQNFIKLSIYLKDLLNINFLYHEQVLYILRLFYTVQH